MLDHSKTYTSFSLRNIPHITRAVVLKRVVKNLDLASSPVYADVGCSNGYLTNQVAEIIHARSATGFDHSKDHLAVARKTYPHLAFREINLNDPTDLRLNADFITCLETIEHVGDMPAAVSNLKAMLSPKGKLLLTVPIEIGPRGIIKYILKTRLYNYSLNELSPDMDIQARYKAALYSGERIDQFRDERDGWGTHFGFDYRTLEEILRERFQNVQAWNFATSRFFLLSGPVGIAGLAE